MCYPINHHLYQVERRRTHARPSTVVVILAGQHIKVGVHANPGQPPWTSHPPPPPSSFSQTQITRHRLQVPIPAASAVLVAPAIAKDTVNEQQRPEPGNGKDAGQHKGPLEGEALEAGVAADAAHGAAEKGAGQQHDEPIQEPEDKAQDHGLGVERKVPRQWSS